MTAPMFYAPQEQPTSDDWYTPAWIFEAMDYTFDLDVAAPPDGVPWIPCRAFYTKGHNGLAQPWRGVVWMNPPFSEAGIWAERFVQHANGVALLPMAKSAWFTDTVWPSVHGMLVLPANLKFHVPGEEGGPTSNPTLCVLAAMGRGLPPLERVATALGGRVR